MSSNNHSTQAQAQHYLKAKTRLVPDFPHEGILFEDLTPVLADPGGLRAVVRDLAAEIKKQSVDLVAGLDARGFLLASAVAYELGVGVLAIRKGGKLPPPVLTAEYELEYGTASVELPADGTDLKGKKIAIVDDVLATGGTLDAAIRLITQAGAKVSGLAVVLEVKELNARDRFKDLPLYIVGTEDE